MKDSIRLSKDEFSIHFLNKQHEYSNGLFYAARIAVWKTDEIFKLVSTGMEASEVLFFAPASGLAGAKGGYQAIFPDLEGNHYLHNQNEEDRRLRKIEKKTAIYNWHSIFSPYGMAIRQLSYPKPILKIYSS